MYHFPFTKLPPLTGSTSQPRVVCVCVCGWGWTHQRGGGKGKPETCNFKLGCAHKMHGTAISYTGMYDCSLYSNSGDWHPVYHTGRAKSCLMFSVSPVILAPLISSLIGPCMMDSGTSGLSKLMLQSKPSSFVHKLCFKKRKEKKNRLCEKLWDRPIHQCHNLFLSSQCILIKTPFEVTTLLLRGSHTSLLATWHAPSLLPACLLSLSLSPFASLYFFPFSFLMISVHHSWIGSEWSSPPSGRWADAPGLSLSPLILKFSEILCKRMYVR